LADKPLGERLAFITQAGTISASLDKKDAGCVLWQIQKKEDVKTKKIINLINGYMRTPKIEALPLRRAINWFNQFDNCNIDCLGLDFSPIDSNG
jgi:hypothetical protein